MSTNDTSTLGHQGHEWAQLFAISLDEWCKRNGMIPKSILKDQLGIPDTIWKHFSSGGAISDKHWYALVFQRTNLPEADPRTIPPRLQHIPRTGQKIVKQRAMSEQEWQEWLTKNPSVKVSAEPTPTPKRRSSAPKTSDKTPPVETERQKAPPSTATKGIVREYRHVLQRRFDALFEQVMSEVVSRNPNAQDDSSVDQLIWALKSVFEKLGKMDVSARTEFAREHGRTLASIFPYVEAYSRPDEKKREIALSLIFGFYADGELTQE